MYNRAELRSSDHRPVFALFRTVVWIVDRAKRDSLARLLLENVTSTSADEKLDEKLAALALHPQINDCAYFNSVLEFYDLTDFPVPPPSSEDHAWWDGPGTYCFLTYQNPADLSNPASDRPSKRCLHRYGSGRGTVSIGEPIRFANRLSIVIFPFVIRRRAVHSGSAGSVNPRSGDRSYDSEETPSITLASEQTFVRLIVCVGRVW